MAEYIERELLMENFCKDCNDGSDYEVCEPELCFARQVIKSQPAADVAPVVHGRWVEKVYSLHDEHTDEYCDEIHYACTVCECEAELKTPYCPYCGVKMFGKNGGLEWND